MSETTVSGARCTVKINGKVIHNWLTCEVGRDLGNISGTFRFEFVDEDILNPSVALGDAVEIEMVSVVVLKGYVEALNENGDERSLRSVASGRDVTGDLVDCAANPTGPAEYRKVTLETVVGNLMQPFGLSIDRQVATGAPFTLVALDPSDTVLGAVERLSRQRGVLVTSNGVCGLVLTQAGTTRAKDKLVFPGGNVRGIQTQRVQRHSDTFVKGQFNSLLRGAKAPLDAGASPASPVATTHHTTNELAASCRLGHCIDTGVTRYRPVVHMAKSQSGGSIATQNASNPALDNTAQGKAEAAPADGAYRAKKRRRKRQKTPVRSAADPWTLNDQAAWRMRTARAHASAFVYIVPGLVNAANELWKPNQLVTVKDARNQIDGDMLIGAVTWVVGEHEYETRVSVVPPDAYDLTGEAENPSQSGHRKTKLAHSWGKA